MRFAGKVALVTGGGRGIGAATARLLAQEGARVLISARTRAELDTIAAPSGGAIVAHACDVSDESAVHGLFDRLQRELGPCDILINNAAVFIGGELGRYSVTDWDRTMAVNLRGPFLCTRAAFGQMSGRGGVIVNVSSLGGIQGTEKFPGTGAYVTSKAGVVALTEASAVEGKPLGIRVVCVAPGAVDTQMLRQAAPQLRTQTGPEDLAKIVADLCSPAGAATGSVIQIHTNL